MRIWKDIIGYEGLYQVNDLGKIKRLSKKRKTGKILNGYKINGYIQIILSNRGIRKNYYAHRIKAIAFIPNPENKPRVNHRDGNRSNNGYHIDGNDNLERSTASENHIHAYKILGRKPNRKNK